MIDTTGLMAIAAAFFVAAASPGPATLAVATVAMHAGRKAGLQFGMGLSFGLAFWGVVAATGLGAVLQASSHALSFLKLAGGAYLLWLAYNAAKSTTSAMEIQTETSIKTCHWKRGLFLNLSNPKAVIAWMAALTLGLGESSNTGHIALATGLCIVLGFLIYTVCALMFSTSGAMAIYRRMRKWIEGAVAGLFAIAGLGLIRSAFVKQ